MSVPAFRNSRSRVRRRRSHHALKAKDTSACPKCEAPILPHRACLACGYYNGRQVIGVQEAVEKKLQKKKVQKKQEEPVIAPEK
ncbi:50S ribosomal protein L32 [Patescibacteria group bacterium]|nr:50S ribosomal protein L32 [Patescibacteria group bacterium]